ncbi:MAG: cell division FtsA domain-containing protein [bacterium]
MKNILFLDIGSKDTKYALYTIKEENIKNGTDFIESLLIGIEETKGINLGRVNDYYDYENFINEILKKIKQETDINSIDNIFISVGGYNLYTTIFSLKEEVNNLEITGQFIENWISGKAKIGKIDTQKFVALPEDYENIVSILPRMYIIDSIDRVYNPFGLTAKNSIEVELLICSIGNEYKKTILKPFEKLSYEFSDNFSLAQKNTVSFLPNIVNYSKALGSYKVLKNYPPFAVMDLGYSTTEVIIILEGNPYTRVYIKRGIKHLIKDISFSLGADLEESEKILFEIGDIYKKEDEFYLNYNPIFSSKTATKERVSKNILLETVIYPRLEEIANLIKVAIQNVFNISIISNFILVGGGAKIKGINKLFSNVFEAKFSFFDCPDQKFSDYQLINLYGMKEHFLFKLTEEYKKNKYPALKFVNKTSSKNVIEKMWQFFRNYFF